MELFATLRFYLDNSLEHGSSAEKQTGEKEYAIFLRPESDVKSIEEMELPKNQKTIESIMAHELGHFIAETLNDPSHSLFFKMMAGPVRGEEKAWQIAEEITEINPDVKKTALDTYYRDYGRE